MLENTQNNDPNEGVTISDASDFEVPIYRPEPTVTRVQDLIEDQRETGINEVDRSRLEVPIVEVEPAESDKVVTSSQSTLSSRQKQARRRRNLVLGLLMLLAVGVVVFGLALNFLGF